MLKNISNMNLTEACKYFIELLKEKQLQEDELKELNKDITLLDSRLAEKMTEEDCDEIVVDDLKLKQEVVETFSLDGGGKWDDEGSPFHQWLESTGNSALIKTKKSVHHQTRASFLKELRANGSNLPDFINVGMWNHVKYNKSAIKRMIDVTPTT